MADIVSPDKRRQMMSGIRSKDTKPEITIRKGLYGLGLRYRKHGKNLKGHPDLVFPKHQAVLFINGCFWHRHDCALFKLPSSRREFWKKKLDRNFEVDRSNLLELRQKGWRVGVIWECSLKGSGTIPLKEILEKTRNWILSAKSSFELRGQL